MDERQRMMVEAAARKVGGYRQLAGIMGVTRQSLWLWQSGNRTPSPERWVKLCNIVGSDLEALLGGNDVD
jgi:transcriptional regulator with XRE-family HTH domain